MKKSFKWPLRYQPLLLKNYYEMFIGKGSTKEWKGRMIYDKNLGKSGTTTKISEFHEIAN